MDTFKQFIKKKHKKSEYTDAFATIGKHSVHSDKNDGYTDAFAAIRKHSVKHDNDKKHSIKEASESQEALDLHNSLTKHYNNYTEKHKSAIRDYTKNSTTHNGELYEKRGDVSKLSPEHKTRTEDMDSALHAHKTPHEFHVYSGMHTDLHKVPTTDGKKKIELHAFTSTSLKHDVAKDFAPIHDPEKGNMYQRHIIRVKVPKGHHGAYVDHHSSNAGEKEFVLPRGTKMHVNNKPTHTTTSGNVETHTWDAEIAK